MELLLRVVVYDNTNLRARLEGLELNKSFMNVPTAEVTTVPPATDYHHASTST